MLQNANLKFLPTSSFPSHLDKGHDNFKTCTGIVRETGATGRYHLTHGIHFSYFYYFKICHDCWYDWGWKKSSNKQHH